MTDGAVLIEGNTVDEWKDILSVSSDEERYLGLSLDLSLFPNQYYQDQISVLTFSGRLNSVFGPVSNETIYLMIKNETSEMIAENGQTDESGHYEITIRESVPGVYRFYTLFTPPENIENDIESQVYEITIREPESIETGNLEPTLHLSGELITEDSGVYQVLLSGEIIADDPDITIPVYIEEIPDDGTPTVLGFRYPDSEGKIKYQEGRQGYELPLRYRIRFEDERKALSLVSETILLSLPVKVQTYLNSSVLINESIEKNSNPSLTLTDNSRVFCSGENLSFSGKLSGENKTPMAYRNIYPEIVFLDGETFIPDNPVLTDRNGSYQFSYHLPGPSDLIVQTRFKGERDISQLVSEPVNLTFNNSDFNPEAKEIPSTRQIDIYSSVYSVKPHENLTISGWFSDHKGEPVKETVLNLFQYNIRDHAWDRYMNTTEAVTSSDGLFSFLITARDTPQVLYLAAVSQEEIGEKPLFSNLLAIEIYQEQLEEPVASISSIPVILTIMADPREVETGSQTTITASLTDFTGIPIQGAPLIIYYSKDGFTWVYSAEGSVITDENGIFTLNDSSGLEGYHYYRAIYEGTDTYQNAESETFIVSFFNPE